MPLVRVVFAFCAAFLSAGGLAASPRIAGCPILPAQDAWNTPIDKLQVHPSSATWVSTIGANASLHPDFGTFYQGAPIGIPFVTVPGNQPPVPVNFTVADESDPGPYPIPANAPIEGGSASSGDRHVLVLDRGACALYELFSAFPQGSGSSWNAYSGAWFDLGAYALRPDTWTSADAAGLPILPGLVRYDEFAAGAINHAIRFTAPQTLKGHVWPARHHASSLTGSQYPPMGARFRLKAGFDTSTYSPQIRVILEALRKYGMILADNGGAWYLSGEHNPAWSDDLLGELKRLKGSDFEAVDTAPMRISDASSKAFQPPPAVTLREIARGFSAPLAIAHAGDGSGRLFVVEKNGVIKVVKNGNVLATPFLDIRAQVASTGERGLLGLAFHPQFAANRRFFVYYTMLPDNGTGGALRISSFRASATNPDVADAASEAEVITIAHPVNSNHNGGHLAFGPDGYLYAGTGDGGSGGDPPNNAQTLSTLLGKLLRLDVSAPAGYAIPASNPAYTGIAGARREIWAYGLRNPWRFSFDRATGDLYIGDVGQDAIEEIDFVPAGTAGGINFGWRVFEGRNCFNPPSGCSLANHTPPVLQYGHDPAGGISVTGGYVYRGARSAALRGYYLYGDFGSNRVWAATHDDMAWSTFVLIAPPPPNFLAGITAFGEDESGEIHVANLGNGRVYAIDGPADRASASTNVALASAGAVASASSSFGSGYPVAAVIDNERAGASWTNGGGWADATADAYPDWVQVNFNGTKTIDRVVVYTVQDAYASPAEPTDSMTFTQYGIVDFTVQGWDGTQWVVLWSVNDNNLVKRTVRFAPFTTDRIRVQVTRALTYVSRVTEIEAWSVPPAPSAVANVALATNGAAASASSAFGSGFPVSAVINGERAGANWSNGGGWADGTIDSYPDSVQVDFNGTKTLDRIVVYTLQDNWPSPVEPGDAMTFTQYGIVDFTVQGWNGSAWVTLGTAAGNNLVKRTFNFAPFATNRIRVVVTNARAAVARITEIEAWTTAAPPASSNVALASAGAAASTSSTFSPGYSAAATINGERAGANWTRGGGWADDTIDAYPDWVQVDFDGAKTLDRVVVYTLQDNWPSPVEPTDAMTFTSFGVVDFTVQGWNGAAWVSLGAVTGNNLVKRTLTFAPFTTERIRVVSTRALAGVTRITEIEAWGQ
jgi:glucose/arabinose dehydrogenase